MCIQYQLRVVTTAHHCSVGPAIEAAEWRFGWVFPPRNCCFMENGCTGYAGCPFC